MSEGDFEAIFRRSLIIRITAKFFDDAYLQKHLPNGSKYGIFPRDPSLKDFMVSPPACAAGIHIQQQFEEEFNAKASQCLYNGRDNRRCLGQILE